MRIVDLSQEIDNGVPNLANLDQVAGTRFVFAGFPLRLKGAHGGPTRAVAIIG
ncbi:MAG: hypothetical protein LBI49_26155 [Nocardiopsaceae bacterium]|jgi:kynurenine formamidase|nr:hypothetical protein [Nocardiopsaceae bacterium]